MKRSSIAVATMTAVVAGAFAAGCARQPEGEAKAPTAAATQTAAAPADAAYPTRVYFGDTHLHTAMSMDAGAFGNRLGIEEAYRFAKGEEITASGGLKAKLTRPLDFLVVADHSDNMGFFPALFAGKPEMLANPTGKKWYDMIKAGKGMAAATDIIDQFSRGTFPKDIYFAPGNPGYTAAWHETVDAAEKHNAPGKFTTFIGYEWTSQVPPGNNLHRVVIYRDGGDKTRNVEPFTTYPPAGSTTPEDLWKVLQAYQDKTGGQVLAIAHNGNLSNGMMFPWDVNPASKQPLTREYAETRIRWEPLYEATQMKGDGEVAPVPVVHGRTQRLRALGQVQPQPERGQEAGDVAGRVRAHRAADGPAARAEAGRQPVQVRHDRFD